jgi:hypothetical protein
VGEDAKREEK